MKPSSENAKIGTYGPDLAKKLLGEEDQNLNWTTKVQEKYIINHCAVINKVYRKVSWVKWV